MNNFEIYSLLVGGKHMNCEKPSKKSAGAKIKKGGKMRDLKFIVFKPRQPQKRFFHFTIRLQFR